MSYSNNLNEQVLGDLLSAYFVSAKIVEVGGISLASRFVLAYGPGP